MEASAVNTAQGAARQSRPMPMPAPDAPADSFSALLDNLQPPPPAMPSAEGSGAAAAPGDAASGDDTLSEALQQASSAPAALPAAPPADAPAILALLAQAQAMWGPATARGLAASGNTEGNAGGAALAGSAQPDTGAASAAVAAGDAVAFPWGALRQSGHIAAGGDAAGAGTPAPAADPSARGLCGAPGSGHAGSSAAYAAAMASAAWADTVAAHLNSTPAGDTAATTPDISNVSSASATSSAAPASAVVTAAAPALTTLTPALPPLTEPRPAAAPFAASIPVPVSHPAFAAQAAQQIHWLTGHGIEHARINVTPVDLGPIEIRIAIVNSEASISFTVTHPETSAAIENALPRLREMLASSGISLGHTSVGSGAPGSGADPGAPSPGGRNGHGRTDALPGSADAAPVSGSGRMATGARLLDLFA